MHRFGLISRPLEVLISLAFLRIIWQVQSTFLILLFPRDNIYQAISIIIAVKVLLASLTCLYAIRTTFPKTPSYIAILLAICYAFSGYAIVMYQITAWMDIVYLFPILWLGLKKVLMARNRICTSSPLRYRSSCVSI